MAAPPWQERLITLLRYAVLIALLLLLFSLVAGVLLVIFAGVLLGVFLRGLGDWVAAHTKLPVSVSLAVVIIAIIVTLAAVGYFLAPSTSRQLDQLATQLPQEIHRIEGTIEQTPWGKTVLQTIQSSSGGTERAVVGGVYGVATTTFSTIAAIIVVFFVGLYLAVGPEIYLAGALRLVPPPRRDRARDVLIEVTFALRWWLVGRLVSMAIIAVMSSAGLWLLGVPLALTLGLLSGVLSFVPYIGSVSSAIPPVLIALTKSTTLALYVILLYVVVHVVEGYILVPLMQKRMVHLPPALTLCAQAVLGALFGIIGLALATPLTAAAIVAVRMLYVEDMLHDETTRSLRER